MVYSLSKYMYGHNDVVMGAAIVNDKALYQKLQFLQCGNAFKVIEPVRIRKSRLFYFSNWNRSIAI